MELNQLQGKLRAAKSKSFGFFKRQKFVTITIHNPSNNVNLVFLQIFQGFVAVRTQVDDLVQRIMERVFLLNHFIDIGLESLCLEITYEQPQLPASCQTP